VKRLRIPIASFVSALLIAGANAAPPMPLQPGERPVPGSTEAELWYGMDQVEKDIKVSPILVKDPRLNAYVHDVVCKIAGDYCKDLRVYIVDVPVFNAETYPNGMVLVFTGALLRMHDEAELAVVLGHEFAHYERRHTLQQWDKTKHTAAVVATLGVGTGIGGGIALLAGGAALSQHSRDLEREADRLGYARTVELGYDPQTGVRMWERFLREEKANKSAEHFVVFASHPRTEERLEDVRAAAAAALKGDYHDGRDAYRIAVRPFLAHWLDEELSRRTYDTSIQVITDLREGAPADTNGTLTFYLAQAYRQRRGKDDTATASRLYKEAIALPDAPADAWREYGLDLKQNGQRAEAADALHRYLKLAPEASDRAFIEQYLVELEKQP
jgi:predicted Zn-dependent protease